MPVLLRLQGELGCLLQLLPQQFKRLLVTCPLQNLLTICTAWVLLLSSISVHEIFVFCVMMSQQQYFIMDSCFDADVLI